MASKQQRCVGSVIFETNGSLVLPSVVVLFRIVSAVLNQHVLEGLSYPMALQGALLMMHPIIHLTGMLLPDFKQMLFVAPFVLPLPAVWILFSGKQQLLKSLSRKPYSQRVCRVKWWCCFSKIATESVIVNKIKKIENMTLFCVCICAHTLLGLIFGSAMPEEDFTSPNYNAVVWSSGNRACSSPLSYLYFLPFHRETPMHDRSVLVKVLNSILEMGCNGVYLHCVYRKDWLMLLVQNQYRVSHSQV